jgi:hypothetical protein
VGSLTGLQVGSIVQVSQDGEVAPAYHCIRAIEPGLRLVTWDADITAGTGFDPARPIRVESVEFTLLVLLDAQERERLLRPGMRAADLGAAPGGWTWVLARHGLRVTSIDNGPLRQQVMTPASSTTCVPTASAGSRRSRWTGWCATWSSNRDASPSGWPPGCVKAGAGARSSTSSCR